MKFRFNFKYYVPLLVVIFATLTAFMSLFGEDSFLKLRALEAMVISQQKDNDLARLQVQELKRQVYDLRYDKRSLEKAVRNELGMARPNEEIFIFEKRSK